ncbi:PQQ-dependent sugar dehydrogenase [Xanthomonas melonis]|uniref:Glucose dehydrogenase n=1 Tax=Xanthomonas melonis TaxID=56456 RepID=A0A2S7DMR3_9XANT|nr:MULTISPECIES: PQQ-dependent sugar dehydrogenase [Xanthomonas]MCC4585864.1 PQQ-dependent sugar dehydrogenase [Xanthomonas sp. NCPPB 1067]MCC4601069.1 PQQ-dependent sugar dehydrogenase [Xanthomonas melonis]MCD0246622.1 PQQ-dependent sugar dehydrogenase [Xanthomonas melonis]MCD0257916.1 PQQ-dependent sugar dehydrogenase [Xanthomonas melonis]MCD0266135.1 PQQ-dependent sugar dehydrogenase [Xanthomonas melonis]
MSVRRLLALACSATLFATGAALAEPAAAPAASIPKAQWPFQATVVADFDEPWAMSFLPDGTLLVSEKRGALMRLDTRTKRKRAITGVPTVAYGGQGGFGDVVPHPNFSKNGLVYLSYAELGQNNTRGGAVARAKLTLDANGGGTLSGLQVIWRQVPYVSGNGHFGHRIAFGKDGKLWITSSERQRFDPAQDMKSNLGKLIRLNDDGSVPADNPFAAQGGVAAQVWSLGHRNLLGIAFDAKGQLWEHEMGPAGGDELNLIQRGANYGYPIVSNGDHYDGRPIPDHNTRPEFAAPKISWTPVISPAGFVIYNGKQFPAWRGNGFIGGLSSRALVRVSLGDQPTELARYDMEARIREVEQGPDGALWLLEDEASGSTGRLLKLTPKSRAAVDNDA